MTDGLAFAVVLLLTLLTCIGLAVAWWVHRPQHAEHDPTPRIQPLFGGDLARAKDRVEDEDPLIPLAPEPAAREPFSRTMPPAASHPLPHPMPHPMPQAMAQPAPEGLMATRMAQPAPSPVASRMAPHSPASMSQPPRVTRTPAPSPFPSPYQPPRGAGHGPTHGAGNGGMPGGIQGTMHGANGAANGAWNGSASTEGHSVRFDVPADGTLQFLPGRLEIVSGQDKGREIRFVRLPDMREPEMTFGRNEGARYRHVQLRDGTVSRLHARMVLRDGRWSLTNLSTTNPVSHNGRVLAPEEQQMLDDEDRVEMGEVVFRFRSR